MQTVLIVIHLMIVSAMIGLVLLQKSEGGGLGMGGGGGGFLTSRGTLQRADAHHRDPGGGLLRHQPGAVDPRRHRPQAALDPAGARAEAPAGQPANPGGTAPGAPGGLLDRLKSAPAEPQVPRQ